MCFHTSYVVRKLVTRLKVAAVDVWTMKLANLLINYFLKSDNVGSETLDVFLSEMGVELKLRKVAIKA